MRSVQNSPPLIDLSKMRYFLPSEMAHHQVISSNHPDLPDKPGTKTIGCSEAAKPDTQRQRQHLRCQRAAIYLLTSRSIHFHLPSTHINPNFETL
ncbi:hypothetical protein AVEN_252793-1 [Araneus ventricosus]|uniref:Uncharacterized protein n=1 Tax=Araneus ventricosus TaxID=182803 RepID=A0A4Y2CM66_ARAVE|nr:hypothetical protein AVEN_252793-1 [Araneus ventricosus]